MDKMLQVFRTAPPSRQLLLIAAIGAVICALFALVYFAWFRTSYEILYRDLREADAATIVAELDRTHVDYRLADGGHTIMVPEGSVDATRLQIAGQDLPLQGTVGFELFNNSSIGLTEFAQRINLQRALQGELARTIMNIEGVESARVHLSLGEQTIFRGDRRPPRASVAIQTRPGRRLNATTVRGIQRLVAGSVPDLDAAAVAVLNDRGAVISPEAPVESAAAAGGDERRNVERFFETQIRRAIETRYPAEAVEVTVWAGIGESAEPLDAVRIEEAADSRDFRLRATVAIAATLSEASRRQVTEAVEQAIGFDSALGDSVTITGAAPIQAAEDWGDALDMAPATGAEDSPPTGNSSLVSYLWTPLALLLLVIVALVLFRRRRTGAGLLSEQERLAYVANLKSLLAQKEANGTPSA